MGATNNAGSGIEIISALNSIGAKVDNIISKPFETRQKSVDITEFDASILMTISYEFRVKRENKNICNVEYFGNEYDFEKTENIYSEWFEVQNKQRVHLRVYEHPIYIIYPGALRNEQ